MEQYFRTRYWSGGSLAGSAVYCARQKGALASPKLFSCNDCGIAATEYDHRDYNKPLDVVPICRSCNARRGRAIPKVWAKEAAIAYGRSLLTRRPNWFQLVQYYCFGDFSHMDRGSYLKSLDSLKSVAISLWLGADGIVGLFDLAPELFMADEAKEIEKRCLADESEIAA